MLLNLPALMSILSIRSILSILTIHINFSLPPYIPLYSLIFPYVLLRPSLLTLTLYKFLIDALTKSEILIE